MDEQQQELAALERSFAETAGLEVPAATEVSTDTTAAQEPEREPVADATPEADAQHEAESPAEAKAEPAEAKSEEDPDPVLLDGLKRSELRRLLGNAADVENLKRQVDKAHGHIGELNRRIQQAQAMPPVAAKVAEVPPELQKFEEDYPEVAQYVRAVIVPKAETQESPAPVQQPQQAAVQAPGIDPVDIELAVMDRMHTGWRDKVQSPEWNLWAATQGASAVKALDAVQTADELGKAIGQFDQWTAAHAAAADKTAKGQQRLKAAVTPTGNAPRPQAALTEQEAMEAAFKKAFRG